MEAFDRFVRGRSFLFLLALLCVSAAVVYRDFLSFSKLFLFKDIGSDSINEIYPILVHNARYLREEGLLGWSFYQGLGQNIYPHSLGDPFRWVLYLLGEHNLGYGIAYVEVVKILLSGSAFYLYVKKIGATRFAAVVGGLMYAFSAMVILGGQWERFSTTALYIAFLLYAFECFYQDGRWSLLPIAIFLAGSLNTFNLYLSAVFLVPYILFRHFSYGEGGAKRLLGLFGGVGGLCALGALMSSVFLLPGIYEIVQSPRVAGDATLEGRWTLLPFLATESKAHNVTAILRAFSTDLVGTGDEFRGWGNYFGAPMFYIGLPTLLLFPYAFLYAKSKERIASTFFALFWLLPVLLPYFRYAFWGFSSGYYRALSLFAMFPLLYLSMRSLTQMGRFEAKHYALWLLTPAVLVALLFFPYFPAGVLRVDAGLRFAIACFIVVYTVLIFGFQFERVKPFAQISFLLLLVCELSFLSDRTVNHRPVVLQKEYKGKVGYNDYTVDAIEYLKGVDSGFFRIEKNYWSSLADHQSLNDAKVQQFYGTPSYHSFNQRHYIRFLHELGVLNAAAEEETRWVDGLGGHDELQIFASVKYQLTKGRRKVKLHSFYEPIKKFGDVVLYENSEFLPLGFTYESYLPRWKFDRLNVAQKTKALFESVVVDDGDVEMLNGISMVDDAKVREFVSDQALRRSVRKLGDPALQISSHSQNRIDGKIETAKPAVLFFSIPYDTGWSVSIDGKKVNYFKANIGFIGVPLPAGNHAISLSYKPVLVRESLAVSSLSFLVFAAVVVRDKRRSAGRSGP